MTSIQEDIFNCVLSGDLESIKEHFDRESATEESQEKDLFGLKDEGGRNALLTASMLGRSAIVRELVGHGARVTEHTVRGYSSLHLAACWGHLDTVRTLLELGADTQTRTFRGDRPVDLALKYSRTDCADCLILAEAKQDLMSYIAFVKDLISDPEKTLTKEETNGNVIRSPLEGSRCRTTEHARLTPDPQMPRLGERRKAERQREWSEVLQDSGFQPQDHRPVPRH